LSADQQVIGPLEQAAGKIRLEQADGRLHQPRIGGDDTERTAAQIGSRAIERVHLKRVTIGDQHLRDSGCRCSIGPR
jgi:hypothetical protein